MRTNLAQAGAGAILVAALHASFRHTPALVICIQSASAAGGSDGLSAGVRASAPGSVLTAGSVFCG